jgi:hypothetical protein
MTEKPREDQEEKLDPPWEHPDQEPEKHPDPKTLRE